MSVKVVILSQTGKDEALLETATGETLVLTDTPA